MGNPDLVENHRRLDQMVANQVNNQLHRAAHDTAIVMSLVVLLDQDMVEAIIY